MHCLAVYLLLTFSTGLQVNAAGALITKCTTDDQICPDGTVLGRDPHVNCTFPACDNLHITYTVENLLTGDARKFNATLIIQTESQPFYKMMKQAQNINRIFRFTSKNFPRLGQYITSINSLYEDKQLKRFWALLKRDVPVPGQDCTLSVGVSSFYPRDKEHVVFHYATSDIFNHLPKCPK